MFMPLKSSCGLNLCILAVSWTPWQRSAWSVPASRKNYACWGGFGVYLPAAPQSNSSALPNEWFMAADFSLSACICFFLTAHWRRTVDVHGLSLAQLWDRDDPYLCRLKHLLAVFFLTVGHTRYSGLVLWPRLSPVSVIVLDSVLPTQTPHIFVLMGKSLFCLSSANYELPANKHPLDNVGLGTLAAWIPWQLTGAPPCEKTLINTLGKL